MAKRNYPTLAQVANKFRDLAVLYAPRKRVNGGNLKTQLAAYNRPSGMVKMKSGKMGYTISLDAAPPNAGYGKFWNDPNVSWQVKNQKTGNDASINFSIKALNSNELTTMINEYNAGIIDESMKIEVKKIFDKAFAKLPSNK